MANHRNTYPTGKSGVYRKDWTSEVNFPHNGNIVTGNADTGNGMTSEHIHAASDTGMGGMTHNTMTTDSMIHDSTTTGGMMHSGGGSVSADNTAAAGMNNDWLYNAPGVSSGSSGMIPGPADAPAYNVSGGMASNSVGTVSGSSGGTANGMVSGSSGGTVSDSGGTASNGNIIRISGGRMMQDEDNIGPDIENNLPNDVVEAPTTMDEVYRGSMKALLLRNVGNYVVATFLIGTQATVSWEGILYDVGNDYLAIYQTGRDQYIVSDLYSLKYVEFYDTRRRTLCDELIAAQEAHNESNAQ